MKKDPRQETARLRQDWNRERSNLDRVLSQVQEGLSNIKHLPVKSEDLEQIVLFEKSLRENIEGREKSLRLLERNSCLLSREQELLHSYALLQEILRLANLRACGLISAKDLDNCNINTNDLLFIKESKSPSKDENEHSQFIRALFLEYILTRWQVAAAHIIERELLLTRRIGSICFISRENALLALKLGLMVRIGLISLPDKLQNELLKNLIGIWTVIQRNFHIQIIEEDRPSIIITNYANQFDALFLDYWILSTLEQQYPTTYLDFISELETTTPFLILLLKQSQVELHLKALKNMKVDVYPLTEDPPQNLCEEDISTLIIARRRSRYILHSARDPWDILVRDFSWNRSKSLDNPSPAYPKRLPNPFHLSEKILIASNFAIRIISTSLPDQPSCTWLSQREGAYWKKFGGKIPQIPRLLSEKRSPTDWKFVFQLGQGNWEFARKTSPDHLIAQAQSLLQALVWFQKQNLFLNNIRFDTIATNGPEIRLLSLERVSSQETEDTISSLLWFWYDLGHSTTASLRPWPIEYFPDESLSGIPEPLQEIAQSASSNGTLCAFLERLPSFTK